ncbi:MAG: polysaccharide deacetylase family protein [Clostridiales bacterium]|nr:polysaccharide deacetylase family protein [Clostridiales bacterium]
MSYMPAKSPRPSGGNPKRTMTAQLRALGNTVAIMATVFMVLLVAFVWMVTAINKKSAKNSDATTAATTATSATIPEDSTSDTVATDTTAPETTPEPTKEEGTHASYPEGTKLIALTFDDGPCEFTPQVLDTLEKHGIPATFFLLGQNVTGTDPQLLQRMLDLKCEIGNHTWSHTVLSKVDENKAYEELQKCDQALMDKIGQKATVIRPPQGAGLANPGLLKYALEQREFCINWNDISCPADWQKPAMGDAHYTAQHVIDNASSYDCVLLHDSHKSTVESLDEMIQGLKDKGYVFVTVTQLLEATSDKIGIEEARKQGWTDAVEAYPGGPVYGVRYEYSSNKYFFGKKSY